MSSSARMLQLLSLLQTHRYWPGGELARRLEVSDRTLRRDVERLRDLGYPVHAVRGAAGGYQLQAGAAMPPLLLDDEEAVAIVVGLQAAAGGMVDGIEETSARALSKVVQVMPPRLRRRVDALASYAVPAVFSPSGTGATFDADVLATLAQACRDDERVRFGYRPREGEAMERTVEPHRLVSVGRRWYLVAWDAGREDWRTFRVDRIEAPPSVDRVFVPREPPAEDIAAYVSRGVAQTRDRWQARVVLHAPLAEVAPRVPPAVGTLEPIDEHSCLLLTGSDWLGGLAVYVAEIGVDFEVLEPPEFAERVRVLADRFRRAAG